MLQALGLVDNLAQLSEWLTEISKSRASYSRTDSHQNGLVIHYDAGYLFLTDNSKLMHAVLTFLALNFLNISTLC